MTTLEEELSKFYSLSLKERQKGIDLRSQHPRAFLRLQESQQLQLCGCCKERHRMLIIQQIGVVQQRKGHGTRIVLQCLETFQKKCAPEHVGVWLQSTITPASKALARSLGMQLMTKYTKNQFTLCNY
jgi:hypothetical protein